MTGRAPYSERLGVRRAPFSPSMLPLGLWLAADFGVGVSGADVLTVEDRGAGHTATSTAGSRPTLAAIGGRISLAFTTAQYLDVAHHTDLEPGTGFTVYAVMQSASAAGGVICGKFGAAAADRNWRLQANLTAVTSRATITEVGTNTLRNADGGDWSTSAPLICGVRWSGSNVYHFIGRTTSAPTACAGAKTTPAVGLQIARDGNTGGVSLAMNLHELIIVRRYLAADSDEDLAMQRYLKPRWGTP